MNVFIGRANKDFHHSLEKVFDNVLTKEDVEGKTVFLKPNWVNSKKSDTGVTTDIPFLGELSRLLLLKGAKKVVIGDGSIENTSKVISDLGAHILKSENISVVNLDEDAHVAVKTPHNFAFRNVFLPKSLMESDLVISVPKIKTHETTLVTLGIKNFYGFLNKSQKKAGHVIDITSAILDIFTTIKSLKKCFCIVDGRVGLEGKLGPIIGRPVKLGLIIGGRNMLAVDEVCTRLMGVSSSDVPHLSRLFRIIGVDAGKISVVGPEISEIKKDFELPPLHLNAKSILLRFIVNTVFRKTPFLANENKCVRCLCCVRACPVSCVSLKKKITFDYSKCIHCLCCCEACKYDALDYSVRNSKMYSLLKLLGL